jgi:hypothetical protein
VPEERRSEKNTSDDFADHWRLANRPERNAEQAAGNDDRCKCEQDVEDDVRFGRLSSGGARRFGHDSRGRVERLTVPANEEKECDAAQHHRGVGGNRSETKGGTRDQFRVHKAKLDTSLTKIRLPEMVGCVQVSDSATL